MLRMAPFEVVHASSAEEAVALTHELADDQEVRYIAGGTDVLVNIKHELFEPVRLVHLGRASDLRGVSVDDDVLEIGALTTLHDLVTHDDLDAHAPGLRDAAESIAGPQHRRMGTLGGNLCLDTRCLYYNQTYFWRESMGFCLKKDGTQCHVVASGKKCVAAASNDTATLLLTLDTELDIRGKLNDGSVGVRTVPLDKFYKADGADNNVLQRGDLVEKVRVRRKEGRVAGFAKLRHRDAIDYPLLSVAVSLDVKDDVIEDAKLVVNALAAKPKVLKCKPLVGQRIDDDAAIEAMAQEAKKKCAPMTNICDDPNWRKAMVAVYVKKAIAAARARL